MVRKNKRVDSENPEAGDSVKDPDISNTSDLAVEDAIVLDSESENDISGDHTELSLVPQGYQSGRPSFLPLLLGGVVAGAIGFGAGFFASGKFGFSKPDTLITDELSAQNGQFQSDLSEINSTLIDLSTVVAASPDRESVDALDTRQTSLDSALSEMAEGIETLSLKITDLENRPIPDVGATADAVETYERELTAMREMFSAELQRIEAAQIESATAQVNAAIQADSVAKQAAFSKVEKAVDSGDEFIGPLNILGENGIDIPPILTQFAKKGVITQAALQLQFPDAARSALDAAIRAGAEAGTTGKLTAFLRTQLGTRSLGPKDGNDPDAILSRAEAALKNGDIEEAAREVSTLPDAGKDEMAGWLELAQGRLEAVNALQKLSATIMN